MRTKTDLRASRALGRLVLRPGTHVLRRSASELQVGLDARRAVVLPDRPQVRSLLHALTSPASVPGREEYDDRTLEVLAQSDLLVDVDTLLPLAPTATRPVDTQPPGPVLLRTDVAALAADAGDRTAALLVTRSRAQVDVATCGSPESVTVAAGVVALLDAAGVRPRLLPHGAAPDPATGTAVTGLLVTVGEPAREELDGWMRTGTPHLLLRLTEGHAKVGPFVLPGDSACLRCVDAHHTDVDPAWPLLVAQYASAVTRQREDAVPEPVDTLLATLAGAWTARELVSYVEGRVPATVSTTVRLDSHLTALETHHWPRHPACGCAWS